MNTKIHIQFGDRKFDYEGETPLAREALIEAFDRLHGGITPEEHAEEFGSSFATQPERDVEASLEIPPLPPEPLEVYCIARNIWVDRHGGSNPWGVGVLAGAILLDMQYPGQPFTRAHLNDEIKAHAPRWGKSWPVMYAGKYLGQAIKPGLIEEAGEGLLRLSDEVREAVKGELKR